MAGIRYLVTDVAVAIEFYRDQLGFELIEQWGPAFAIVARDGMQLWLSGPQTSAAQPMPDGRTPEPGGWNRIVMEVRDLAALVERLKAAGVRFRNEIITGPGGSQVLAEDGVGNVVELFEPRRG
jgi:catechol 2,3-dioxygenase-like lactoylglutathione lyase family enzyme